MRILNFIFKAMSWLISLFVVVGIVAMVVLPYGFKICPYIVQSGSMEPKIPTGSLVWVDQKDTDAKINDIVTYQLTEDTYVTHRIIDTDGDLFITKGDANETEDLAPVSQEQIIGTYMFAIPLLGFVLAKFKTTPLLAVPVLSVLIAVLIINSLLEDTVKTKKKRKKTAAKA